MQSVFTAYYVKLQQAYYSESNKYGGWQLIGYSGPGESKAATNGSSATNNFQYTGGIDKSTSQTTGFTGWTAHNVADLNDCTAGDNWTVVLADGGEGIADKYTTAANGAGCQALTPTFDKIGN